jgi:hypothetical protein
LIMTTPLGKSPFCIPPQKRSVTSLSQFRCLLSEEQKQVDPITIFISIFISTGDGPLS